MIFKKKFDRMLNLIRKFDEKRATKRRKKHK